MVSNNIRMFLDNMIIDMADILKSDEAIDKEQLTKYRSIKDSYKRLLKSYNKLKQ